MQWSLSERSIAAGVCDPAELGSHEFHGPTSKHVSRSIVVRYEIRRLSILPPLPLQQSRARKRTQGRFRH